MNIASKYLAVLTAFLAALTGGFAQNGDLVVRVFEDLTDAALEGASVSLPDLEIRRTTDRSGRLTLRDLPAGEHSMTVDYRGLPQARTTVTVVEGELTAVPIRLGDQELFYEMEDYAVVGFVTNEAIAQQMERNALNIKDVIASDTMGQLPDRTVADAVRRIPGVSVERSAGQAENEYVTIRGLNSDFNKVSIDGVALTVSNFDGASRSVPLNVISSDTADQIEVTKAATPEMDADAIGGTIDIRTKNAFDYGGRHATAEFAVGYAEIFDDFSGDLPFDNYFPSFSFTFSDFLNEAETLGISISADYRERVYLTSDVSTGGFFLDDGGPNFPGEDLYFAESVTLQELYNDIKQWGLTTALDWRPDEFTTLRASLAASRKDDRNGRQRLTYFFDAAPEATARSGDTATAYDVSAAFADRNVRDFEDRQDVFVFNLDGEKELDVWTLFANFGFNRSEYSGSPVDDFSFTLSQFFDSPATVTNAGSFTPDVDFGADVDDIGIYDFLLRNGNSSTRAITDDEFSLAADAEREATLFELPFTLKFGGKARFRERDFDDENEVYDSYDFFGTDFFDRIGDLQADYGPKERVDGNYPGGIYIDPDRFRDLVKEMIENPGLDPALEPRDPFGDGLYWQALDAINSYEAEENIFATYAQGTFELGKFTLLGGVRLEYTDVTFRGSEVTFPDGPGTTEIRSIEESNDYLNILPGFHVRYDASEELIFRGSVNRTIARPSYRQLNPTTQIEPGASRFSPTGDLIERGNIDLDPTESWNFDLGADYYYSESGYVSLGVFAKLMENNIYEFTSQVGDDEVVETRNANDAEVYGLEFAVDQGFTFLPGPLANLGASFNFTLVDSSVDTGLPGRDEVELFGQVGKAVNASIHYRDERLRARLSYNWSDDYLLFNGLDEDPNLDGYADAYGTLDFTMGYYLTDRIEIFFEAENLTDAANRGYDGDEDRLRYNTYEGRTFFVGANWTL